MTENYQLKDLKKKVAYFFLEGKNCNFTMIRNLTI